MANLRKRTADVKYCNDSDESESDFTDSDDDSEFLLESTEGESDEEEHQQSPISVVTKRNQKQKDLQSHEWSSIRAPPPSFQFNESPGIKLQMKASLRVNLLTYSLTTLLWIYSLLKQIDMPTHLF